MIRLAFVGQQRSGKDTAGEIFNNWVDDKSYGNINVHYYSFAQSMKDLCLSAYDNAFREDLQGIGAAVRSYDPKFWVRIVEKQIIKDNPQFAVVTDVRYPNEVKTLVDLNFHIIGIDAPDEERFLRSGEAPENWQEFESHESEVHARAALLNAPHIIKNSGGMDYFREQLETYFEEIQ